MKKIIYAFFITMLFNLYSQSTGSSGTSEPAGFRQIQIGMGVEQVKELLMEDPYFDYRGDPDVSFLPEANDILISCAGFYYIKEAFFQFYQSKLFTIIIVLNEDMLDYYTMFTGLMEKYGKYSSFSPSLVVWEFPKVILTLEKPLIVKYMDKEAFNKLQKESGAEEDFNKKTREEFLDEF